MRASSVGARDKRGAEGVVEYGEVHEPQSG